MEMKREKPVKFALALGAGGARGLAHLGVIESLLDCGISIDYVTGSSIGAIIGALYCHRGDLDQVRTHALELINDPKMGKKWEVFAARKDQSKNSRAGKVIEDIRIFINNQYLKIAVVTKKSLAKQSDLMDPLKILFGDLTTADLKIPFSACTVDLKSGKELYLDQGKLTDIVYASSAIPGIFPPLERDGMLLADGSVTDLVPVEIARQQPDHSVIAVDFGPGQLFRGDYSKGVDIMMRADELARIKLNDIILQNADVVISPQVDDFHWAEFNEYENIIRLGREAVLEVRDQIEALRVIPVPTLTETPPKQNWFAKLMGKLLGRG